MALKGRTILQILPALNDGGVEQSTLEMARYIVAHGGVALVASAGGRLAAQLPCPHITLPLNSKNPLTILANAWRLAQVIRSEKPDIIHARSRAPAWSAWLACCLTGMTARFITTFHGTYGAGNIFKRWYNSVMLKGRYVIANSQFIAAHIHAVYGVPTHRIVVAPRGVDDRFLASVSAKRVQQVRWELSVSARVPSVLMTGRLTRWKGQHVLLKALAGVQDIPWVVAFAGSSTQPAYADELQTLAHTLGLDKRVRWLGQRADMPDLNAAATVAVSCSTSPEAFGRVAIEAMAVGTPVIATALGGSLETVLDGTTGWLVPPHDVSALARALRVALTMDIKRRTRMAKVAQTHVRTYFTAAACCAKEAAAYMKLFVPS